MKLSKTLTNPSCPPVMKEDTKFFMGLYEDVEVIGYDNGEEQFMMPISLFYAFCLYFEAEGTPDNGVYN